MIEVFFVPIADPGIHINFGSVPGLNVIQNIFGGVGALMLMVCVLALMAGGGCWAAGSLSASPRLAEGGKRAVLIALVGAFLIGGGSAFIRWASGLGEQVASGAFDGLLLVL
ncbi:hypothetical protein ACU21_01570 [Actinobaculum suis]|nr:hypothetical protein ACU21_01570 [Actinobaculum suis]